MRILQKALDALDEGDLQELIDGKVDERQRLEYKRELPGGSDRDRSQFLSDVTSLANAAGGALLFGIAEHEGVPVADGLDGDPDAAVSRLEQMLLSGVQPRLHQPEFRTIKLATGRFVLVLRVRRSWSSPHMVTFKGSQRFYARRTNGKYQLDVHELREAFAGSGRAAERVRDSRLQRLAAIAAGETRLLSD